MGGCAQVCGQANGPRVGRGTGSGRVGGGWAGGRLGAGGRKGRGGPAEHRRATDEQRGGQADAQMSGWVRKGTDPRPNGLVDGCLDGGRTDRRGQLGVCPQTLAWPGRGVHLSVAGEHLSPAQSRGGSSAVTHGGRGAPTPPLCRAPYADHDLGTSLASTSPGGRGLAAACSAHEFGSPGWLRPRLTASAGPAPHPYPAWAPAPPCSPGHSQRQVPG